MKSNRIKSLLLVVATFVFSSTLVFAQPQGRQQGQQGQQQGPPAIPDAKQIKNMVNELSTSLGFTKDQETSVNKLYVAHFEVVAEKMSAGRPDRSEMESLKSDLEASVNKVLTEEQAKLYKKILKKQSEKQSEKQPERRQN